MKPVSTKLSRSGTTVFTLMSALATQHGAINLGQGFPDTEGPADIVQAAAAALLDGRNQYAPLTGLAELREAVAAANARDYGLDVDPGSEVVVTSGATEAITACLAALLDPGDEVVLLEPLFDTYLPVVRMLDLVCDDAEMPYAGSRSQFGEMVRRSKRERDHGQAVLEVPLRFEGLPGEYLQVDWGEIRAFPFTQSAPGTRYFLACRLKYSRWV